MARGRNEVTLIGAIARQPELKYTPAGIAVLELVIAGNDQFFSNGEIRDLPWYHRTSLFGKTAETEAELLTAGEAIAIFGGVDFQDWTDNETQQKRSALKVRTVRFERIELEASGQDHLITDVLGGLRLKHGLNEVHLVGNLTRDAEFKYTPSGDAVASVSIAVNEVYKDAKGAPQEKTHYVEVTLWRDLAEQVKDAAKGQPIFVKGRLTNESWTDKDGKKRSQTKVEALSVVILKRGEAASVSERAPAGAATRPKTSRPAPTRPAAAPATRTMQPVTGLEDFPEEDLPF